MILQLLIYFVFLRAADASRPDNDWEYLYNCPRDSLICQTSSKLDDWSLFACGALIFIFLLSDFIDGFLIIYESITISDNWGKILEHHRSMILNAMSPDGKVQAAAPTSNLLEVMNQTSITEQILKANAIMKREGARVHLPLVMVKALVSGDWCNEYSNDPSKVSMFFIGPCSKVDDDENIRLQLKIATGKGLSDDTINKLLKKDYYIPTSQLELKEQMRLIAIFHNTFLGPCINTLKYKRLYDIVAKREVLLQRHFQQDKMIGARFITAIDNDWNLLLEESESCDSPADIPSTYFSCDGIIAQLERGSFTTPLPRALTAKHDLPGKGDKDGKGKRNKTGEDVVHNVTMLVDAWKLKENEENKFKEIFNYKALLDRPDHSSGCKLCHKWAVKRYCFSDCRNKASHGSWSTAERSKFDAYQKKVRGL